MTPVAPPLLPTPLRDAYLQRLGLPPQLLDSRGTDAAAGPAAAAAAAGRRSRPEPPSLPLPTLAWLRQLTSAHIDRVAYEDFDIHLGLPPSSLDPLDTAARIARHHRGGYCFQLNGALASLLATLGFQARMYRATVRSAGVDGGPPLEADTGSIAELNHAVIVVSGLIDCPDQQYVADAGLGDGPSSPIRLAAGEEMPLFPGCQHCCRLGEYMTDAELAPPRIHQSFEPGELCGAYHVTLWGRVRSRPRRMPVAGYCANIAMHWKPHREAG